MQIKGSKKRLSASCSSLVLSLLACALQGATCAFFISHKNCGFGSAFEDFIDFERHLVQQTQRDYLSVGICNWGIRELSYQVPDSWYGQCLQCILHPYDTRQLCPSGYKPDRDEPWYLASNNDCAWGTCLGGPCENAIQMQTASCGMAGISRLCCPIKPYQLCCKALACQRMIDKPSDACVVADQVLRPGQSLNITAYAVPVAVGLGDACNDYSFTITQQCSDNNTLPAMPGVYTTCSRQLIQSTDNQGCPVVPGYTLVQGAAYSSVFEGQLPDAVPWDVDSPAAVKAAASDITLMAARCDNNHFCAAFDMRPAAISFLRSHVPLKHTLFSPNSFLGAASLDAGTCVGAYVKDQPLYPACERVPGYVFIPGMTWQGGVATQACKECANSRRLAADCDAASDCVAFSNMHGVLVQPDVSVALQQVLDMTAFTQTPCRGMFIKTGRQLSDVYPGDISTLDSLLCGQGAYCQYPVQYQYARQHQSVKVILTGHVSVPSWLTYPNQQTRSSLPVMPGIQELVTSCSSRASLIGQFPEALWSLLPNLKKLDMRGCGLSGSLPSGMPMSQLSYLDLSGNQLSGALPETWTFGSYGTLQYLNMSQNQLTGTLPAAWLDLMTLHGQLDGSQSSTSDKSVVMDLSHNQMEGPLPQTLLGRACVAGHVNIVYKTDATQPSTRFNSQATTDAAAPMTSAQCQHHDPAAVLLLLHGNAGIGSWSQQYTAAQYVAIGSQEQSEWNMCAGYRYIMSLALIWGASAMCLAAIILYTTIAWWRRSAIQQHTANHAKVQKAPNTMQAPYEGSKTPAVGLASIGSSMTRLTSAIRDTFTLVLSFARTCLLLSDISLDILVLHWLWNSGGSSSVYGGNSKQDAAVAVTFLLLPQLMISLAMLNVFFFPVFSSMTQLLVLSPPLIAVLPCVAPLLALWNVVKPRVPLVAWRYLELLEFCVVIGQAPAQAVLQSVVYAHLSKLGEGLYLPAQLFLASIALSLLDMLATCMKLARSVTGPGVVRRIKTVFVDLDQTMDVLKYQYLHEQQDKASQQSTSTRPMRGESYRSVDDSNHNKPAMLAGLAKPGMARPAAPASLSHLKNSVAALSSGENFSDHSTPRGQATIPAVFDDDNDRPFAAGKHDQNISMVVPGHVSSPYLSPSPGMVTATGRLIRKAWTPHKVPSSPPPHYAANSFIQKSSLRLALSTTVSALGAAAGVSLSRPLLHPAQCSHDDNDDDGDDRLDYDCDDDRDQHVGRARSNSARFIRSPAGPLAEAYVCTASTSPTAGRRPASVAAAGHLGTPPPVARSGSGNTGVCSRQQQQQGGIHTATQQPIWYSPQPVKQHHNIQSDGHDDVVRKHQRQGQALGRQSRPLRASRSARYSEDDVLEQQMDSSSRSSNKSSLGLTYEMCEDGNMPVHQEKQPCNIYTTGVSRHVSGPAPASGRTPTKQCIGSSPLRRASGTTHVGAPADDTTHDIVLPSFTSGAPAQLYYNSQVLGHPAVLSSSIHAARNKATNVASVSQSQLHPPGRETDVTNHSMHADMSDTQQRSTDCSKHMANTANGFIHNPATGSGHTNISSAAAAFEAVRCLSRSGVQPDTVQALNCDVPVWYNARTQTESSTSRIDEVKSRPRVLEADELAGNRALHKHTGTHSHRPNSHPHVDFCHVSQAPPAATLQPSHSSSSRRKLFVSIPCTDTAINAIIPLDKARSIATQESIKSGTAALAPGHAQSPYLQVTPRDIDSCDHVECQDASLDEQQRHPDASRQPMVSPRPRPSIMLTQVRLAARRHRLGDGSVQITSHTPSSSGRA